MSPGLELHLSSAVRPWACHLISLILGFLLQKTKRLTGVLSEVSAVCVHPLLSMRREAWPVLHWEPRLEGQVGWGHGAPPWPQQRLWTLTCRQQSPGHWEVAGCRKSRAPMESEQCYSALWNAGAWLGLGRAAERLVAVTVGRISGFEECYCIYQ